MATVKEHNSQIIIYNGTNFPEWYSFIQGYLRGCWGLYDGQARKSLIEKRKTSNANERRKLKMNLLARDKSLEDIQAAVNLMEFDDSDALLTSEEL
jgi:hypothetical protein